MVSGNFAAKNVTYLPWNAPDGLPERVVQAPATSLQSDELPPVRRGELEVRALPTGTVHILAPLDGAGLVVRLSHLPARISFATAGQVTDAIMRADGRVIILERIDGSFTARELKPSQSAGWRIADLAITGSEVPRLLADARGRVFVASSDRLISPEDGIGRLVARWPPGVPPLMHPDGRPSCAGAGPRVDIGGRRRQQAC